MHLREAESAEAWSSHCPESASALAVAAAAAVAATAATAAADVTDVADVTGASVGGPSIDIGTGSAAAVTAGRVSHAAYRDAATDATEDATHDDKAVAGGTANAAVATAAPLSGAMEAVGGPSVEMAVAGGGGCVPSGRALVKPKGTFHEGIVGLAPEHPAAARPMLG